MTPGIDRGGRVGADGVRSRSNGAGAYEARSRSENGDESRSKNLSRARAALVIGGVLLAAGAGLAVWDAASDDSPAPVVITGRAG